MWYKNNFLFWFLVMSAFFIHHLTTESILTQYQKAKNQTDTFEKLETKLTHSIKVNN